ncbi:Reverse transcriptase (RNA-dependent DNA polymerase) [Fragilaria crotonensis]|nr:Reverse transcriptase (RNA-dependent DNA polymerase) [Fragilaria crotonensis]
MGEQMDHTLINPNQLRHFGVQVQDNPYEGVQMHLATEDGDMIFPLDSDGTTIFLSTRTPTAIELHECPHIVLTSRSPWDPHAVQFPEPAHRVEEGRLANRVSAIQRGDVNGDVNSRCCNDPWCDTPCLCLRSITERLIAEVRVPEVLTDVPGRRTFVSQERHSSVTPEELSERWCIGLTQARNTVQVTTQNAVRSAILPLSRRYRADRVFERPLLRGHYYCDTMDGRHKSLDGNKYAQIFASKDFFAVAYPMESKSGAGEALRQFVHDFGRPERLTSDGSREQSGKKTEFVRNVRKYSIDHRVTEPDRPNHNFAEGVIREIRKKWYRVMTKKNVPRRLWDYGLRWVCEIQNRTSNSSRELGGRCPLEKVTGESVDISEYLDFGFYDRVWYKDNAGLGETKLGRWLGVSHKVGTLMSFWVLTKECQVLSRTTVQRVTNLEQQTQDVIDLGKAFDSAVIPRLGDPDFYPHDGDGKVRPTDWDNNTGFDDEFYEEFGKVVSDQGLPEADRTFTLTSLTIRILIWSSLYREVVVKLSSAE